MNSIDEDFFQPPRETIQRSVRPFGCFFLDFILIALPTTYYLTIMRPFKLPCLLIFLARKPHQFSLDPHHPLGLLLFRSVSRYLDLMPPSGLVA